MEKEVTLGKYTQFFKSFEILTSFLHSYQVLSFPSLSSGNDDMFGIQTKVLSHLMSSKNLFDFMGEGGNDKNHDGSTDVLLCPEQVGGVKNLLSTYNVPFFVKSTDFQK
jgi:hypothetical protein